MSWISIDYEKCLHCSQCVYACPLRFLKPVDDMAVSADETNCNRCGHCAAICPERAITHHGMDMRNFIQIDRAVRLDTDQFIQFIRERRSHRHYRGKPVERALLEKLIDTVRYSPTGGNAQNVELIVVQDPLRIKKLSDLTVDHLVAGLAPMMDELHGLETSGEPDDAAVARLRWRINFTQGVIRSRDIGLDPVFHSAPCVAVFHSTAHTVTPKDNCVIAATIMGLTARCIGLETTYIAMFENAANAYAPLTAELRLPAGNKVYSVLVLGYPRLEFRSVVDRKPIQTRWE